jgi:hypothetical protein
MLFRISKTNSNNREVFPNIMQWGMWVIEYDNQFKPIIENNKFILGKFKPKDNKYQRVFKAIDNDIEFNNFCGKIKDWETVESGKYIELYENGEYKILNYEENYTPPVLDNTLDYVEVATIIKDRMIEKMHGYVEEFGELDLYLSGGIDTGMIHAIALHEKLPVTVHTNYKNAVYPLLLDYDKAGPQQQFCAEYQYTFRQLPPVGKNVLVAFGADVASVAQAHAAKPLYKFLNLNYDECFDQALLMEAYNTSQKKQRGFADKEPINDEATSIIEAKWNIDFMCHMDIHDRWDIDDRHLLNPTADRDFLWYQMGLQAEDFNQNHHDKIVYKTIIKMTAPEVLNICNKFKENPNTKPIRIPKRWLKEQKAGGLR